MPNVHSCSHKHHGFSLIELMVALVIGLLLLTGLSLIFLNSSQANRELQNTAQQIENGRYASSILTDDIHHAGFFGRFFGATTPPLSTDPCELASVANFTSAMAWHIQGFRAADLATRADISSTTCGGLLTNANLLPGSDVLVIRRAQTQTLAGNSVTNEVYVQASATARLVRVGTGAAFASAGLLNRNGSQAPIRKYVVRVYFVAPCSVGSGTNGVCTSSDDAVPTLKRLELTSQSGTAKMVIVPLVEGIEYMKVEYGVDNIPATVSSVTNQKGNATVDSYTATPTDWPDVIAAKVYLLARNTDATKGYADDKTYVLGSTGTAADYTVTPTVYAGKETFKRHAYTTATRIVNVAARREIP